MLVNDCKTTNNRANESDWFGPLLIVMVTEYENELLVYPLFSYSNEPTRIVSNACAGLHCTISVGEGTGEIIIMHARGRFLSETTMHFLSYIQSS